MEQGQTHKLVKRGHYFLSPWHFIGQFPIKLLLHKDFKNGILMHVNLMLWKLYLVKLTKIVNHSDHTISVLDHFIDKILT